MKMPEDPVLDEFCDALWLEDGLSRNTLDSYRRDLTQFQLWLAKQRHTALLDADHGDLLAYLAHRVAGHAKATTTSRLLSSFKRFLSIRAAPGQDQGRPQHQHRCAQAAAQPAQKPDRRGRREAARRAERR